MFGKLEVLVRISDVLYNLVINIFSRTVNSHNFHLPNFDISSEWPWSPGLGSISMSSNTVSAAKSSTLDQNLIFLRLRVHSVNDRGALKLQETLLPLPVHLAKSTNASPNQSET